VHHAGSRIAARLCHADAWNINRDGHGLADAFGLAAQRARQAGFDMVEIDALGLSNRPQDLVGRMGLIMDAVMEAMGPGRTGVRLGLGGGCTRDRVMTAQGRLADALCLLDRAGIGYLHLQSPLSGEPDAGLVRGLYRGRLVLNTGSGVRTGQRLIAQGCADAVVLPARTESPCTVMAPALAAE
jgi:2,4-dienoyl-CoA reductase-like NADH-dependent reductase (Old Yellow Enzyme family)